VRLVLLGVRGSTPAPGAAFVRYGGHTSCVAVLGEGEAVPSLVLDAGTGLRQLPGLLGGEAFSGSVVLTHLHWDHLQGLPFCPAIDRDDARVDLHLPGEWASGSGDEHARLLLARTLSPPHFPIGPEGLLGDWRFLPARPGPLPLARPAEGGPVASGPRVTVAAVPHKGGVTFGIRVELDGAAVAYLPDHAPAQGSAAAERLAAGVDVLLHDGQFRAGEEAIARAYGHSTIDEALLLADRCQVGRLVLTHHAPARGDDELDALATALTATRDGRPVTFARQGDTIVAPDVLTAPLE
jgi:ribonuclease BN (tRNA processing enzyme)